MDHDHQRTGALDCGAEGDLRQRYLTKFRHVRFSPNRLTQRRPAPQMATIKSNTCLEGTPWANCST